MTADGNGRRADLVRSLPAAREPSRQGAAAKPPLLPDLFDPKRPGGALSDYAAFVLTHRRSGENRPITETMLLYLLGIWTAAAPDDVTSEGLTRALQPDPRFEQLSATLWRLRTDAVRAACLFPDRIRPCRVPFRRHP